MKREKKKNVKKEEKIMKSYGYVSYAVDRFLEPLMRSARQCLMIGTDTTLDQD